MLKQSNSEVIVVDYGCVQGTAEWVKKNYPNVIVIKFDEDPVFSLSIARNLGLRKALGNYVLFVDADVFIKEDLGLWVSKHAQRGKYYKTRKSGSLSGSFVCERNLLTKIGGYDEAFRGWGGEDIDLYKRLELSKVYFSELPSFYFEAIEHDNELRGLEGSSGHDPKVKARWIFRSYLKYKQDFFYKNKKFPELTDRKNIFNSIKENADRKVYEELLKLPNLPNYDKIWVLKDNLKKNFMYKIYFFIRYGMKR